MLVLQRKQGTAIKIGDGVEVFIREVRGKYVSVAVSAPKEIRIIRSELNEPINRNDRDAI